jgi:hypothetical protein
MKLTTGILVLFVAIVMSATVPVSIDGVGDNSGPLIMALDVCHGAAFGSVLTVDAPVIHEYVFALQAPAQESDIPVFVDPAIYEVCLSTLERPPQV